MKFLASILLLLGIAGCATPEELRIQNPAFSDQSQLSSQLVASCIADGWENTRVLGLGMPVFMRPTKVGFTVSIRDIYGRTNILVDIESTSTGSQTFLFENFGIGLGSFVDVVKSCQK